MMKYVLSLALLLAFSGCGNDTPAGPKTQEPQVLEPAELIKAELSGSLLARKSSSSYREFDDRGNEIGFVVIQTVNIWNFSIDGSFTISTFPLPDQNDLLRRARVPEGLLTLFTAKGDLYKVIAESKFEGVLIFHQTFSVEFHDNGEDFVQGANIIKISFTRIGGHYLIRSKVMTLFPESDEALVRAGTASGLL